MVDMKISLFSHVELEMTETKGGKEGRNKVVVYCV